MAQFATIFIPADKFFPYDKATEEGVSFLDRVYRGGLSHRDKDTLNSAFHRQRSRLRQIRLP